MRDFLVILPEGTLLLTAALLVLGEATYFGEKRRPTWWMAQTGLLAAAFQTLAAYRFGVVASFQRAVMSDGLSLFSQLAAMAWASITIAAVHRSQAFVQTQSRTEVTALVLAFTAAQVFAMSATHFGAIWVALALVLALGGALVGSGLGSVLSAEGAAKQLLFAGFALFALGVSAGFFFAYHGTFDLVELHKAGAFLSFSKPQQSVIFILFFFALTAVGGVFPFSFWAVDAFHGAPMAVSGFVLNGLRWVSSVLLLRGLVSVFSVSSDQGIWTIPLDGALQWRNAVGFALGASAIWLAVLSTQQDRLRRRLACLGLVQTAQAWAGILVLDETGFSAALYHIVVSGFALIGAYFVLGWFVDHHKSDRLADLSGVIWTAPREALVLGAFLLTLAGAPPTPGFLSLFSLVTASIRAEFLGIAGILVLSSVVATGSVIHALLLLWGPYRVAAQVEPDQLPRESRGLLFALMVPLVLLLIKSDWLLDFAGRSLSLILW